MGELPEDDPRRLLTDHDIKVYSLDEISSSE
jgi:hypothetical protein